MDLLIEEWKDIPEFNGWYQASSLGRIRSVDRLVPCKIWKRNSYGFRKLKGKILIPTINSDGYNIYNISLGRNKPKSYRGNRLVCSAFYRNPNNLSQVNHKDGVKTNDNKDNLEWISASDNQKHAYETGLKKRKLNSEQKVEILKLRQQGLTYYQIADKYNVSYQLIARICTTKNHKQLNQNN